MEKLLNFDSLKILTFSDLVNEQAKQIYGVLKNKLYIVGKGKDKTDLYILQCNVTYKIYSSDVKSKLLSEVTELIQNSYNSLTKEIQSELYRKTYSSAGDILKSEKPKIFSNSFVDKFYPQLFSLFVNDEIKFDTYFNEIHFNNGFIDLKTLEFKQREQAKHYITKYIERDYKKSTEAQKDLILSHIKKTYPNKEDLKVILLSIGSSLSGKSIILLLTQAAITVYFQELQSDTFAQANSKIDKILMTYQKNPQIRISWCNELKDTKIDDSLFKSFIDSNLNATALYADGQKSFKHYSKTFITANTMPNIKIDSGVSRRFKGYTHNSKFVSDSALVDEKNHVYLGNKYFIDDMEECKLLDAWFDILAENCAKWNKGEKINYSKNFQETKDEVMNSNDIFLDFVDSKLVITGEQTDRIGKNKMHEAFSNMYPNRKLTVLQVITSLKEKNLTYNGQLRNKDDSIQGSFFGVKFKINKPDYGFASDDEEDFDYKTEYRNLLAKYNILKNNKLKSNEI